MLPGSLVMHLVHNPGWMLSPSGNVNLADAVNEHRATAHNHCANDNLIYSHARSAHSFFLPSTRTRLTMALNFPNTYTAKDVPPSRLGRVWRINR